MKRSRTLDIAQLFLRLAIGFSFFFYGSDRLGLWGKYGDKIVSWGDWSHFMEYASKVMGFLPYGLAEVLAAIATAAEILIGLLLMVGFKTRWVSFGGFLLAGFFALSMTISFGLFKPLSYGVFSISAACLLLHCVVKYEWSLDSVMNRGRLD